MRAFVALTLPPAVQARLVGVAEGLRGKGDVRYVAPDHLHLTLKFLGDVDRRQLAAMQELLARARWPRPWLRLAGLGRFPPGGAPRVVWAGLAGDVAVLETMANDCEASAAAVGVPREPRPFQPHVTLGRCRSPRGSGLLDQALQQHGAAVDGAPFQPTAVVLLRSELSAAGSTYTELARAACW